jgi:hypothetical protein
MGQSLAAMGQSLAGTNTNNLYLQSKSHRFYAIVVIDLYAIVVIDLI